MRKKLRIAQSISPFHNGSKLRQTSSSHTSNIQSNGCTAWLHNTSTLVECSTYYEWVLPFTTYEITLVTTTELLTKLPGKLHMGPLPRPILHHHPFSTLYSSLILHSSSHSLSTPNHSHSRYGEITNYHALSLNAALQRLLSQASLISTASWKKNRILIGF